MALDAPWPLAGSSAPTKVAPYGRTPGAFRALLAVLAGKATAPGSCRPPSDLTARVPAPSLTPAAHERPPSRHCRSECHKTEIREPPT